MLVSPPPPPPAEDDMPPEPDSMLFVGMAELPDMTEVIMELPLLPMPIEDEPLAG